MKAAIVIACLALAPAGATGLPIPPVIVVEPHPPPEQADELSKDAIFIAGATIFALVAFGSVINVVLAPDSSIFRKTAIVAVLALGIAGGFLGSLFLMWTGCCVPRVDVGLYYAVIFLSFSGMVILLWLAHVFEMLKNRERDPPKGSG